MSSEIRHAAGWASDYFLCGQAPEAPETERGDNIAPGRDAEPGEVVDCPGCVRVIDHVLSNFTDAHRVRNEFYRRHVLESIKQASRK